KPAGNGAILSKMDDAAGYRGFDLLFNNDRLEVHLVHAWPDNSLKVATKEPLPKNTWTHVFVSYDGSSKAAGVKIFVNGRAAPVVAEEDRLRDSIAANQPLRLGKRSSAFALRGELDDVRIYRRALTADEVRAMAEQPLGPILKTLPGKRSKAQQELFIQFSQASLALELNHSKEKVAALKKQKAEFESRIPS